MDSPIRKRVSREYLWFALILLAVLAASTVRKSAIDDAHAHVLADQTAR